MTHPMTADTPADDRPSVERAKEELNASAKKVDRFLDTDAFILAREDTRRLLRDIAAFVEAAEAAMAAKDEWREIESAPRDGTEVLVTGQRTDGRQAGTWLRAVAVWDQVDQAWWAKGAPTHITQARAMRTKPTHWRPLPAPPVTPPEGKKA